MLKGKETSIAHKEIAVLSVHDIKMDINSLERKNAKAVFGHGMKEAVIMGDKEISRGIPFPPTPFLLIEEFKEKGNIYHVIESWKESDIQVLSDCHFMQNIEFTGHKASEEEIEEYMKE